MKCLNKLNENGVLYLTKSTHFLPFQLKKVHFCLIIRPKHTDLVQINTEVNGNFAFIFSSMLLLMPFFVVFEHRACNNNYMSKALINPM